MENGFTDSFHQAKQTYSRCALITLAVEILIQGCGVLLSLLLNGLPLSPSAGTLLTQLPVPLILLAAGFLLRGREEKLSFHTALRPAEWLRLFLIALPIIYGGNLLGNLLASALTMGKAYNRLGMLTARMDLPLALYIVFLGPFSEEFFFRGALLPRMVPYGQKTALILSALFFALYHVNLYQFFYAFGIGLLLGAVALKTGNILAGFLLHASVNLLGGVLPVLLTQGSDSALVWFSLAMLTLAVFGIAPLRRFRQEMTFAPAPLELPSDISARAAARNTGFVLLLVFSLGFIFLDLFSS